MDTKKTKGFVGSRKWVIAATLAAASLTGCHKAMTPKAEFAKGLAYYHGQGVPKNYQKGAYWCRKAAVQGYAPAEVMIGFAYYNGQGVPKNYQKAVYWYRKAARQGNARAELDMGVAYTSGVGGAPRDYVQAYKWFALARSAAQSGTIAYKHASRALNILTQHMSPAQITQAQSLAYKWAKAHKK